MLGPSRKVEKLLEKINIENRCDDLKKLKDITFVINKKHYKIPASDYVLSMS